MNDLNEMIWPSFFDDDQALKEAVIHAARPLNQSMFVEWSRNLGLHFIDISSYEDLLMKAGEYTLNCRYDSFSGSDETPLSEYIRLREPQSAAFDIYNEPPFEQECLNVEISNHLGALLSVGPRYTRIHPEFLNQWSLAYLPPWSQAVKIWFFYTRGDGYYYDRNVVRRFSSPNAEIRNLLVAHERDKIKVFVQRPGDTVCADSGDFHAVLTLVPTQDYVTLLGGGSGPDPDYERAKKKAAQYCQQYSTDMKAKEAFRNAYGADVLSSDVRKRKNAELASRLRSKKNK
jgi:hypothetical protein